MKQKKLDGNILFVQRLLNAFNWPSLSIMRDALIRYLTGVLAERINHFWLFKLFIGFLLFFRRWIRSTLCSGRRSCHESGAPSSPGTAATRNRSSRFSTLGTTSPRPGWSPTFTRTSSCRSSKPRSKCGTR